MNNSALIYKKLVQHGVKHVFGYSGGAIMPLMDQFHPNKNNDIDLIINSHEQNCGHAATGYAKSSGKTGIVLVTSGPGITNCITPFGAVEDLSAWIGDETTDTGSFCVDCAYLELVTRDCTFGLFYWDQ